MDLLCEYFDICMDIYAGNDIAKFPQLDPWIEAVCVNWQSASPLACK